MLNKLLEFCLTFIFFQKFSKYFKFHINQLKMKELLYFEKKMIYEKKNFLVFDN